MSSGATIFDDRETVELLRDHPHLLAIADAVCATQTTRTRPTYSMGSSPTHDVAVIARAIRPGTSQERMPAPTNSHTASSDRSTPLGWTCVCSAAVSGSRTACRRRISSPANTRGYSINRRRVGSWTSAVLRAPWRARRCRPLGAPPRCPGPCSREWIMVFRSRVG